MDNKISVKKAGSYYFVGTLFNKGIAFLTVPIFSRILSTYDYGIVNTYNSWVAIMSIVASFVMYGAIRTSFIDYEKNVDDFLANITKFNLMLGIGLSLIVIFISTLFSFKINTFMVCMCMSQSVAYGLVENVSMYLMMKYRYKPRTAIMVLPNFIATIVSIILIKYILTSDLYYGRIIPNSCVNTLFGIGCAFFALSLSKKRINKEYIKYAINITAPLVIHGISLNILSQSDRTMITALRNAEETGIYGLIYNFSMIAMVFTSALDGIWVPYFQENMKSEKYSAINFFANKYLRMMSVVFIGVILVAPEIVKIMAPEPYWEGIKIIPPVVLSNFIIFVYTFYVNIEHFYKKTVFIMINTSVAAVANLVLNLFFIPQYGYMGAAYTTITSYFISTILHYIYARKLNQALFPIKQIVLPLVIVFGAVFVFYFFIEMWVIRWIASIIVLTIFVVVEKDEIISMIKRR